MQFVLVSEDYFSQGDFAEWALNPKRGHDFKRCELLNGRVVVTPPAGYPHGAVEVNVGYAIGRHVEAHGGGRVFGPSQGFELPSGDTVQTQRVREDWLVDPRGCNVRRFVASDGRFDLGTVYEKHGGVLESVVLTGLRVPVAELLAR